jgi:multimeric flavodoxin WrbA
MKTIIISYSLTGNNHVLASGVARELNAKHITISEAKPRTMGTIVCDLLLNRTPRVTPVVNNLEKYDLVIFMGPVWMGQVATPLRTYLHKIKNIQCKYAFITICGGADGPNLKLGSELKQRVGRAPHALIEMHIADLLPAEPKPERKDTSEYRLKEADVKILSNTIVNSLHKTLLKENLFIEV